MDLSFKHSNRTFNLKISKNLVYFFADNHIETPVSIQSLLIHEKLSTFVENFKVDLLKRFLI